MAKSFRIQNMAGHITSPVDARGNVLYTAEDVDAINKEFDRRRLNGNEMEQMIGLVSAGNLFRACAKDLETHADHTGNRALLRRVSAMIKTVAVRLANQVECRQMGAILAQTDGAKVTVAATPQTGYVNIPMDNLLHICNRAMEYCDFCCTCTREQSKECQLRKALELVPGVKDQGKEYARKDATKCPYRGLEMEVE